MASSKTEDRVNFAGLETEFKKDKARTKSNFTRSSNKLLILFEQEDIPSRREVRNACHSMDTCLEIAMEVLSNFSDFYTKYNELQKSRLVVKEMEKIEEDFYTASETAREYLDSRKDDKSSVTSDILTINFHENINIADIPDAYDKQETASNQQETIPKVRGFYPDGEQWESVTEASSSCRIPVTCTKPTGVRETEDCNIHQEQPKYRKHEAENRHGIHPQLNQPTDIYHADQMSHGLGMNLHAFPFEANKAAPSIGQDLWRQLKRVQIPVFTGDKRKYQSWKAAFLACIDSAPATGEYKLLQLRQYLSGDALNVIENLGHSATAYEAAKERLERKYGGKRRQISIYLEDLDNFRQIRSGNARDLEQLADLLDIAIINLKEAGLHHELEDGSLYTKLQRKLPESLLARYHRWIFENNRSESVLTLRTWVIQESEFQTVASETVHGLTGKTSGNQPWQPLPRNNNQRAFFGETGGNDRAKKTASCQLCRKAHGIWKCPQFWEKSVPERWNIAKVFQLCYRCLAEGHAGKSCPRSRPCGQNSCRELHHRLLHKQRHRQQTTEQHSFPLNDTEPKCTANQNTEPKSRCTESQQLSDSPDTSGTEGKDQRQHTTMLSQGDRVIDFIALRTIPVMLKNGGRSMQVNALLDDASTKSYINADVAAQLGLQGKTEQVTVNVLNGQIETFETQPVNIELESLNGSVKRKVTAYTASKVTGNMTIFDWNKCKKRWPYLRDIDFPCSTKRQIVDVLIGLDCADLHCAIEEVRGKPGEPIARLTPLGWTCIGNPSHCSILQTNFACTYFVRDQSTLERLNENLKRFWEIDKVHTAHETPVIRLEEQLALRTAESSVTYENQMYRVGIPWKENRPVLPDNYDMAVCRLENIEKRLKRSPYIAGAYNQCIEQYVEKGYIRKVPEHEKCKSKWYLPHFPVIRQDKETTKTRIVFDASAKYEGVSLNDAIHQGPKLQRDLFDVLLRFRRFPIALVCDIEEMYLRIGIAHEDKPYHRFLWRGINQNRRPDIYEFDRVVFGLNSSPFQAQYVLQQHAKKYQQYFPMAVETVLKSTYMDDSMDSARDEDQAIDLYKQLSNLLTKAGMHARKWLSNSAKVLSEIPVEDRKAEVDIDRDQLPCAKTLGVWWLADKDVFTFTENAPESSMVYTKRNFLKKIATLFDPIGFLAPFTIRAKILLQDIWTAGLEWDEELSDLLIKGAREWFEELSDLKQIKIPRCLWGETEDSDTMSLHTFVDASENAYGAVVYARCLYKDGSVTRNIVAAKTRVAPSISTSIPRLELMAAVVGVRLTTRISKVLDIPMSKSTFWSDSANVLWWVRGRSRQFRSFVSNRVGEIQSHTNPDQWRHIPTKLNPADFLSRGIKATELSRRCTWWRGPDFLGEPEDSWPINNNFDKLTTDVEMKRLTSIPRNQNSEAENSHFHDSAPLAFMSVAANESHFLLDSSRYSSWLKLRRVQAWINRFIENSQKSKRDRTSGELSANELNRAEIQLIEETQCFHFREEWKSLSCGRPLPLNSKLLGLQPKLDSDGLIRSDSRLKHAKFLSYDVRYPVILPRKSWVTKLIVKEFHEKGHHASGTNQTLAALSARYWVMSGREVIREWEKKIKSL